MQNKIQDMHTFNVNIIKRIISCILSIYSNLKYIYIYIYIYKRDQNLCIYINNKNNTA